jgi:hypothetical protein
MSLSLLRQQFRTVLPAKSIARQYELRAGKSGRPLKGRPLFLIAANETANIALSEP